MATTIVTKNSTVAATPPSPGQLVQGELAVNVTDRKLYTLDGGGNVVQIADGGSPYVTPVSITVNSATVALRITQTGAGNALLVEDSANPDSTPFVIDATGNVGIGTTTPETKLHIKSASTSLYSTVIAGNKSLTGFGTVNYTVTDINTDGTFAASQWLVTRNGGVEQYAYMGAVANSAGFSPDIVFGQRTASTAMTERMRITAGGGVSFGATGTAYGTSGQALISAGNAPPVYTTQYLSISFIIDGGGAVITTGIKGDLTIPFACAIEEWTLLADQSGSMVVDIWKDTYANYPPTVGDTITASAKPTISAAAKGQSSTLTGWTATIAAGDTLRFNVDSCSTITRVTLSLKVYRT